MRTHHVNSLRAFSREDAINNTKDGILEIPDGVTHLASDFAFFVVRQDLPMVKKIIIPKSVCSISMRGDNSEGPFGYKENPFCEIIVDEENENFCSEDGVLFSKDKKELICYPCGKTNPTFRIPEGVQTIKYGAFSRVESLASIHIPESLKCIEECAFVACPHLDFPDLIHIYQSQDTIVVSIPYVDGFDYHPSAGVCYWQLTEQHSLETISEEVFSNSSGFLLVTDPLKRGEIMNEFWAIFEDLDWVLEHEDDADLLSAFKNVFYSEFLYH